MDKFCMRKSLLSLSTIEQDKVCYVKKHIVYTLGCTQFISSQKVFLIWPFYPQPSWSIYLMGIGMFVVWISNTSEL